MGDVGVSTAGVDRGGAAVSVEHLLDEVVGIQSGHVKTYCTPSTWVSITQAAHKLRPEHDGFTFAPSEATCPACIEAYETRPQPVTTADLLEVLKVARWLAHTGQPRVGGKNPAGAAAKRLEERLKRPRRVKP